MVFEPAQHSPVDVEQMLFFLRPVTFAGIDDELALNAEVFQPAVKLLSLTDRIDQIILGVQNQRGSLRVLEVSDRRALEKCLPFLERHTVKPVVVLRRSVHLGPEFAGHVGDARADDGSFESRRLCDRPRRHEAR